MTVFYPNLCYNKVYYKGTALFFQGNLNVYLEKIKYFFVI